MLKKTFMKKYQDFANEVLNCQRCLLKDANRAAPYGGYKPVFAFLGMSLHGEANQIPFLCDSGEVLSRLLLKLSFSKISSGSSGSTSSSYTIFNVVACHTPRNRPPEPNEIKNCKKNLYKFFELYSPKFTVALGGVACDVLTELFGCPRPGREEIVKLCEGHWFLTLPHPAYPMRQGREACDVWVAQNAELLKKLMEWKN